MHFVIKHGGCKHIFSISVLDITLPSPQDVSQLQLTIDGVTRGFDQFMEDYVKCYYPNVEEQTFRVPPIHFNIQSFKKPADCLYEMEHPDEPRGAGAGVKKEVQEFYSGVAPSQSDSRDRKEGGGDRSVNVLSRDEESNMFMPKSNPYSWSVYSSHSKLSRGGNRAGSGQESTPKSVEVTGRDQLVLRDGKLTFVGGASLETDATGGGAMKSGAKPKSGAKNGNLPLVGSLKLSSPCSSPPLSPGVLSSSPSLMDGQRREKASPKPSSKSSPRRKKNKEKEARTEALRDVDILTPVMLKDVRADEGEVAFRFCLCFGIGALSWGVELSTI